jgi:hypothetical protein
MLKALRKYNKWILVIGGTLLMMAFLVQPAIQHLGGDPSSQVVARLDGRPIRARDEAVASRQVMALSDLSGGLIPAALGIQDRDTRHWMLLKVEADAGGFIGQSGDGPDWLPELAESLADQQMSRSLQGQSWRRLAAQNPQLSGFLTQMYQRNIEDATKALDATKTRLIERGGMTEAEIDRALADARGVFRMLNAYGSAARMSDRLAAAEAKRRLDSAYIDFLTVPASRFTAEIPMPNDGALQAHLERFKGVRPGEGEFGIGYLLPPRVKLEWLTLDAAVVRNAVPADPVEVNKRYLQDRAKYPGEFPAERARVEQDLKAEKIAQVMQEAHRTIQAEVLRSTRRLEPDGRYKKLPADWAQSRPKMEAVAQAVVDQVAKAAGITLPLPAVTTLSARWQTYADLSAITGLGSASFRTGNLSIPAPQVIFAVRELGLVPETEQFPVPVQVGVPLVENYLTDATGSRYYVTVLDARGESAPDSLDEVREQVAADCKGLLAYERLTGRIAEWRSLAAASGLDAVRDSAMPPPPPADPPHPDDRPSVVRRVAVTRDDMSPGPRSAATPAQIQAADVEPVRSAVMHAAEALDPLTPPEQFDADKATIAAAAPTKLSVVVARITALGPLTRETFRLLDGQLVSQLQMREIRPDDTPVDAPFSLERLLSRHTYVSEGEVRRGGGSPAK